MLLLVVLLATSASGAVRYCTSSQSHYSDTKSYIKADGTPYQPQIEARPAWYRSMSRANRADMESRIATLIANREATETQCCFEEMKTGVARGTLRINCLRPGASPRVEPDERATSRPAVPGDVPAGWPKECSSPRGLSLEKIRKTLGTGGGIEPTLLGKGKVISRWRECNAITGCTAWTVGTFSPKSNLVNWQGGNNRISDADLYLQVRNNMVELVTSAPYLGTPLGSTNTCPVRTVYSPGEPKVSVAEVRVGYMDASGGFGCKSFSNVEVRGGNTRTVPYSGTISNTCLALFSEVYEYPTQTGKLEIQNAYYSSF